MGPVPVLAGRDGKINNPVTKFGFQSVGLCVDDSESATGLAADVFGEDVRVRNAKCAQHPKVGGGG